MSVSKLNLENMNEDLVKRFNTLDLYTKSGLNTETTTALVDALNEIIGKNIISKSVGAPLENTDLWKDMGTKIDSIVKELRDNLSNKGLNVKGKVLSELVNLVVNIPEDTSEIDRNIVKLISEALGRPITEDDSVVEVCENIDGMTKDFRDKLSSKGVNVEETDRMMDLVAKVDDVGRGGEIIPESWETKASMYISRTVLTSSSVNDNIYCIGGVNNVNTGYSNNSCYNTKTDSWEEKKSLTSARGYSSSAVVNGKIYVIGGSNNNIYNNYNECYDVESDTWETKSTMPTNRNTTAVGVINGKIYCVGGFNGSVAIDKNECYDPDTNTWSSKANMTTGRYYISGSVVFDKFYVIGGCTKTSTLNSNECYDPTTDTWTTKTDMITPRLGLMSTELNNVIYSIGGGNPNKLNTNECYNPITNTWSSKANMTTVRGCHGQTVVGDRIYCIGGINSAVMNINECYTPEQKTPHSLTQALSNSLGINTDIDDSVYDVCDIIDELTVGFRNKLSEKGIEVSEDEKIFDLINKLDLL